MTWEYFLSTIISPAIGIVLAVLLTTWLSNMIKKRNINTEYEKLKATLSDYKLELRVWSDGRLDEFAEKLSNRLDEFVSKLEKQITIRDEKNEEVHSKFYEKFNKIELEYGLLKKDFETIKSQHDKNHEV